MDLIQLVDGWSESSCSSFFSFEERNDDRCGRCGNLAFGARFPNLCGRVLCVHRGGSVHIVFTPANICLPVETWTTPLTADALEKGGYQSSHPPRENRPWGILVEFFLAPTLAVCRITRCARLFRRTAHSSVLHTRPA